ncbi:MAG: hypothetical protein A2157_07380 [Deltaproteobacteria bacterium RBG_16_47_11]|nr:MAG: hypothetical protein A2157_07380 [Deltaproteobacteria bacterium RBG_16_47_11]
MTSGGVSAFAGFSFDQDRSSDSWKDKSSFLLGFGNCQRCIFINDGCSGLLGNLKLLSEMSDGLSLCQKFFLSCLIILPSFLG